MMIATAKIMHFFFVASFAFCWLVICSLISSDLTAKALILSVLFSFAPVLLSLGLLAPLAAAPLSAALPGLSALEPAAAPFDAVC